MEKEFVPYEESLAMKELGYNEQDFAFYRLSLEEEREPFTKVELIYFRERYDNHNFRLDLHKQAMNSAVCTAPLWQQAFRWFREKYNIYHNIYYLIEKEGSGYVYEAGYTNSKNVVFFGDLLKLKDSYEEAQLACLRELIKIVKDE